MKKETYLKVIQTTPTFFDFEYVRAFLSGIYAIAIEDSEITSDDMSEICIAGDKLKESVYNREVE